MQSYILIWVWRLHRQSHHVMILSQCGEFPAATMDMNLVMAWQPADQKVFALRWQQVLMWQLVALLMEMISLECGLYMASSVNLVSCSNYIVQNNKLIKTVTTDFKHFCKRHLGLFLGRFCRPDPEGCEVIVYLLTQVEVHTPFFRFTFLLCWVFAGGNIQTTSFLLHIFDEMIRFQKSIQDWVVWSFLFSNRP